MVGVIISKFSTGSYWDSFSFYSLQLELPHRDDSASRPSIFAPSLYIDP